MEKIRNNFAADPRYYVLGKPPPVAKGRGDIISVGSTSSNVSTDSTTQRKPSKKPIIISDDEDDEIEVQPVPRSAVPSKKPPAAVALKPAVLGSFPAPIAGGSRSLNFGENIRMPEPDYIEENQWMNPQDAEKALKDLVGSAMNDDVEVEIDRTEAIVDGFRSDVKLLDHQIIGRRWMKEREDTTKKCFGGILADDMGLGKTIQTLTRIVGGKATKADKDEGYSGCTLVVCPLSLVGQWASEIEKMTHLRVLKHQGTGRTTDPDILKKNNVVVTTYETVQSEYGAWTPPAKDASQPTAAKKGKSLDESDEDSNSDSITLNLKKKQTSKGPKKKCALFGVKWLRVVLDEAHNIKNVKTKRAIACCELQSKFRWCLTGTPMQNNVTELYSLLKFLRIKPFNNWEQFNMQVAKPISTGRGAGVAMKRLQVVLKRIMLRRKKDDTLNGKRLIELPARTVQTISCPFDSSEQAFYTALESKMESVLDKLMSSNNNNTYMSVLLLLLRLRQACNHPLLVSEDYKKDAEALEPSAAKTADADTDGDDLIAAFNQLAVIRKCSVCTIVIDATTCGEGEWKNYCLGCVEIVRRTKEAERDRPTSAKIRMILKLLAEIDKNSDCEEKTIIFSQFTSMLDLIEPFLKDRNIKYTRYDGSMHPKDREAALETIKTSTTTRVILISFKAGSTGLNLTACNNVILVDLWWNPALEDQAFDRAHRYGQTRDVNIYKLKVDQTVEDRILELQEKKRALAAAALSGDKIKNMRLGMDDLLALFRPGAHNDSDDESD